MLTQQTSSPAHKVSARHLTLTAAIGAVLLVMAGCSSTPLKTEAPVTNAAPQAQAAQPAAATSAVAPVEVSPFDDPKSPLSKRSVYFDFDSYQVREGDVSLIEAHAKYLSSHQSAHVRLEGNTDERGGTEYNLALGQKRSEAVRRSMVTFGAPAAAIEAVSFGKEKPVDAGHDEAAWAKNRRVDISYVSR